QAALDIRWLWGASAMMALHWLTDSLDGAVGRHRSSGLVRWGFYMDHFFDLVFASSVFLGYAFLVNPASQLILFAFFIAFTILTASLFLSFPAYKGFIIGQFGIGPTEFRILIIMLNAAIIYLGVAWFEKALPYLVLLLFVYAFMLVYRTQRDMYHLDMRERK
ncbi:MAG: CDP-alcohol phosphatidyltransferase family protein, partial [Patescibacteria group bacterium]